MKPKILFGVLNWGLGHAGRSIPIIQTLVNQGCHLLIASDGEALQLLMAEFPTLEFRSIKGYNVRYPFKSIILNLIWYSIRILRTIISENNETARLVEEYKPDVIISDNRYGFRNRKIQSILICHQINVQHKNKLFYYFGNKLNHHLLTRFNTIWIPDFKDENSIAGKLSKVLTPIKHNYLGPLSRMKIIETEYLYDIAIILSGPEPQRSIFENLIMEQAKKITYKIILVRGLINENEEFSLNDNFRIKSHALSKELNLIMCQSKLIIARSGYSTVMDLIALSKKAVFVPTPGQSEQEYLAEYLKKKNMYYSQNQHEFDIKNAILESKKYSPPQLQNKTNILELICKKLCVISNANPR